jgi:hypothetical protein
MLEKRLSRMSTPLGDELVMTFRKARVTAASNVVADTFE